MRLAVIADIHGNRPALDAVLADIERRGGADLLIDLGDCVSGPLWPRETLERLGQLRIMTVRGNHDREVGTGERATLGLSDGFAHDDLDAGQRRSLAALPTSWRPVPHCLALHGSPDRDDLYLLDVVEGGRLVRARPEDIAARLRGIDPAITLVLCGHSHRADLVRLPHGPLILNPGSVGCPAYDDTDEPPHVSEAGSPLARYAIVDDVNDLRAARIELIALPYDNDSAARRAERNGRPDWAFALRTGLMPPPGGEPSRQPF